MLTNIYFAIFQSLVRYGTVLRGREIEKVKVPKIQTGHLVNLQGSIQDSFKLIFKDLNILKLTTMHFLDVLCNIEKNIYFRRDLDVYEHKRRRKCDIHVLRCDTCSLRGV